MYGTDFWERASITQLVEFIKHGAEGGRADTGTYEERHRRYAKAFTAGLRRFRDLVLETDWEAMRNDNERDMKTEDMYDGVMRAYGDQIDLALEVGVVVGFQLGQEFTLKAERRA